MKEVDESRSNTSLNSQLKADRSASFDQGENGTDAASKQPVNAAVKEFYTNPTAEQTSDMSSDARKIVGQATSTTSHTLIRSDEM